MTKKDPTAVVQWRDERKTERKKLERAVRAALKKVEKYALDGGTYETSRKTEQALYKLRDKLTDELNWEERLGPEYPPVAEELIELVARLRAAVSAAPELARQARQAEGERAIRRIQEKQREDRAALEASGLAGYQDELRRMRGSS